MEEMNYIVWLIRKAEGFEYHLGQGIAPDQLVFPTGQVEVVEFELFKTIVWKLVWFPLLILRAYDKSGMLPYKPAMSDDKRNELLENLYEYEQENS